MDLNKTMNILSVSLDLSLAHTRTEKTDEGKACNEKEKPTFYCT